MISSDICLKLPAELERYAMMGSGTKHEYGGPEKLKFEDNVPKPQIGGHTVLIAAAACECPESRSTGKCAQGRGGKIFPLSFPAILEPRREWPRTGSGRKCKALQGRRPRSCTNLHASTMPELVAVDDSVD